MVSIRIVSRFSGPPSPDEAAGRKISGGPLYPEAEVLELLGTQGGAAVKAWSQDCIRDVQKLELDDDDLAGLIGEAVRRGRFRGAEWCVQKPDGPWAACDAYSLCRSEWIEAAGKEMPAEYYIKFAIGKMGPLLLLASCHLSGS
ncbi:hypothetical protein SAMN04244572_02616 [Azotobacter beijerinckii]|uniref:Uncharacterized protein n=1 Tax=Azotobacter beijerinckii TaxID=170623 RepID=A0A1H6VXH9_9GAMM|nr:hypothetical protein SAMN04244572_02616 [Azotobacter beijerinckii]